MHSHSGRAVMWKIISPGATTALYSPSEPSYIYEVPIIPQPTISGSYHELWLTGLFLWRSVVSESQAGLYYGGAYLIRSTAGKVPALKVQFPLWQNNTIDGDGDIIAPLAEFEIEMLRTKQSGNRNDWNLLSFEKQRGKRLNITREMTTLAVSVETIFSVTFTELFSFYHWTTL